MDFNGIIMIKVFDSEEIKKRLDYINLIDALEKIFLKNEVIYPEKNYYSLSKDTNDENIIINMPAWDNDYFGVKLVSVFPNNEKKYQIPSLHAAYCLWDAKKGVPLAYFDATEMTKIRTAATSALASKYLSKENSNTLLIIGTGEMVTYLIEAHCAVRPIKKVYVWGRNKIKAIRIKALIDSKMSGLECIAIDDLSSIIKSVDIISCATSSNDAIIQIEHITPGQHLDLIGSFTPQSQEVSCEVVAASSIYLDDIKATPKKAGEIYQSIEKGFITSECIKGDLITLCKDKNHKRTNDDEITLFKSVGIAIEDFASAKLIWESRF